MKRLSRRQVYALTLAVGLLAMPILYALEQAYSNAPLITPLQLNMLKRNTLAFFRSAKSGETPLLQSFHNTSQYQDVIVPEETDFVKGKKGYLEDQAFTYDLAIAAMVYLLFDRVDSATELLDDMYANFLFERNGKIGLYNSYRTDEYEKFYKSRANKRNVFLIGIDGDRIHVGPNVFVGLAAQQHYQKTRSRRYIPFMIDVFKWCLHIKSEAPDKAVHGGIPMGSGWGLPWEGIYATEHNIDYFAFVRNLCQIYASGDEVIQQAFVRKGVSTDMLQREVQRTASWLKSQLNPRGTFNRGYRHNEGVDTEEAMDLTSWGIAALGPELMYDMGADPEKMISRAEEIFGVRTQFNGKEYEGFDFTDKNGFHGNRDQRVIWFEGTGEMAVAYHAMANYFARAGNAHKANYYRDRALFYRGELRRFARAIDQPFESLPYSSLQLNEDEVAFTFADWWPMARGHKGHWVPSIISTSWRIFAELRFNPFDLGNDALHKIDTWPVEEELFIESSTEQINSNRISRSPSDS